MVFPIHWVACLRVGFAALAVFAGVTSSAAAVLRVPSEHLTINDALDAAVSGDSVLVAPGTYSDFDTRMIGVFGPFTSIAFMKGGVSLIAEGGRDVTRIDFAGQGPSSGDAIPVLAWHPGADRVVIEGFTITGAPPGNPGMWVDCNFRGYLTVRDCRFLDLEVGSNSGALHTDIADVIIEDCEFRDCRSSSSIAALLVNSGNVFLSETEFSDCEGTGIVAFSEVAVGPTYDGVVRRCLFLNNVGFAASMVGFIHLLVEECAFVGNHSTVGTSALIVNGAALSAPTGPYTLRRNLFAWNTSPSSTVVWERVDGIVEENTWIDNVGRGLFLSPERSTPVTLRSNIFAGTTGGVAVRFFGSQGAPPPISRCNDFWENAVGNVQGFVTGPTDIFADPFFCDRIVGDYTLATRSPCLPPLSGACGQIGAFGPGCGPVSLESQGWGKIKAAFR